MQCMHKPSFVQCAWDAIPVIYAFFIIDIFCSSTLVSYPYRLIRWLFCNFRPPCFLLCVFSSVWIPVVCRKKKLFCPFFMFFSLKIEIVGFGGTWLYLTDMIQPIYIPIMTYKSLFARTPGLKSYPGHIFDTVSTHPLVDLNVHSQKWTVLEAFRQKRRHPH